LRLNNENDTDEQYSLESLSERFFQLMKDENFDNTPDWVWAFSRTLLGIGVDEHHKKIYTV